jgi:phosphoribosylanthranilate isomerase
MQGGDGAAVKVKICGVCSAEDAALALAAGADLVGVIVSGPGPRAQGVERAAAVFREVPAAARAGVFVDLPAEDVVAAAIALELGVVQLHGSEDANYVAAVRRALGDAGCAIWKVVHARQAVDIATAAARYRGAAHGLLLDSAGGGTGRRFAWERVAPGRPAAAGFTLAVAGGLAPENVAEAVALFGPDVVDVSSGVEAAIGRKSAARMRAFVAGARGTGP